MKSWVMMVSVFTSPGRVARRVSAKDAKVEETGAAGLSLLELIKGYERLIIADAILTDNTEVGKIHRLDSQRPGQNKQFDYSA